MKNIQALRSCAVHSGSFHADEVTAVALLIECGVIDRDKVIRTRDKNRIASCEFVCDVGGEYIPEAKRFDHHQVEYTGGLSSAGMVLKYLKDAKLIDPNQAEYLDRTLVHGVDLIDNGDYKPIKGVCTFSGVVASYVPVSYEATDEELDRAFFEALDFVSAFIKRTIEKFRYIQSCKDVVASAMETMDKCLVFDRPIPWLESFFELGGKDHPAHFIIMPAGEHWKLRGIPPTYDDRMNVRTPLKKEWAGLMNDELKKVTGIEGAIFCHKGLFISIWKTKKDAFLALRTCIKTSSA